MDLPDGFHLEPYIDGPALILKSRMVACASPLSNGGARITLWIGTHRHHTHFISSIDAASLYLAKWCTKWEREIRPLYVDQPAPFGHLHTPSSTTDT